VKRYRIPKGEQVWLRLDIGIPAKLPHLFTTEKEVVFTDEDIFLDHDGDMIFRLPKNDRGYEGLKIRKGQVIIEEK
jgi:hypothetical protein